MNQLEIEERLDKLAQETESDIEEVFNRRLQTILKQLSGMYEKYSDGDGEISWTDVNRYRRLNKELDRINKVLNDGYKEIVQTLQESMENIYLEGYLRHMYLYEMSSGYSMRVTLPTMETIKEILLNPIDKLTLPAIFEEYRNQIIRRINIEISQGIQAGESYAVIARRLQNAVKFSRKKARTVVRTEAGRARSIVAEKAEEKAAQYVDIVGVWMSALDLRVRHSHRVLDGKEADSEGYFHYKAWKAKGPHMWGIPSMDINCRCLKLRKVNGMLPEYRRGRNYMDEDYQQRLADKIEEFMGDNGMTYKQAYKAARKEIQPPSTTVPFTSFDDWYKKFSS
ncbi:MULTISPECIES: phage minor head protein [unclassified Oceanobacillus]|uniref:phage minor head protein n=1 Tax=unclassified Oceanobacillus TaxID=2630292 RepID=UPI001BEA0BEF|nr:MULTISPECIES: phage minor head protein [unclassified Oceanobacillus]MBT2599096.1 phage head morphogenesis protein [Oceanobacillus sp. ISL-74]MBT2652014.1 phage head morphogenesis protein [Oceanobacillus sp. ISL-73]